MALKPYCSREFNYVAKGGVQFQLLSDGVFGGFQKSIQDDFVVERKNNPNYSAEDLSNRLLFSQVCLSHLWKYYSYSRGSGNRVKAMEFERQERTSRITSSVNKTMPPNKTMFSKNLKRAGVSNSTLDKIDSKRHCGGAPSQGDDERYVLYHGNEVVSYQWYSTTIETLKDVKNYLQNVILKTDLKLPLFVKEDMEGFVKTKYTNPDYQVLSAVVIENYSTYILSYPVSSNYSNFKDEECRGLRFVQQPPAIIKPGDVAVYIVDNGEKKGHDVCGSISWQILKPDGVNNVTRKNKWNQENNVKLNIEFYVPYSGSCDKTNGRVNRFKSYISPQFKHHRVIDIFIQAHMLFDTSKMQINAYGRGRMVKTEESLFITNSSRKSMPKLKNDKEFLDHYGLYSFGNLRIDINVLYGMCLYWLTCAEK
ncbi:unnamed protein product [Lepeophtheirus salmonis]|uniref:(salmon louse) hypothetical protein n=1 Tax=Lepeophtheirus salmonis TaxID=72036 RepID=A0A817FB75_LEPSM|nr:unnamed protein product [Lepeophtheirus salmonis]CAG9475426.1 unnamed protein product [Lepeophtheirus salmonis]